MKRFSVILLVDPQGRILLQERDEHAPISPDTWGMVGGHVEDGEEFEPAAYRELEEETGIRLPPGGLRQWCDEQFRYVGAAAPNRYTLWVAPTTLTDADIVVGEGRQIVFVKPEALGGLALSESAAHFLPAFLASRDCADLTRQAAG
jgi:8-oxo-dGTP pyrophosphatase MutT (NUDIX family)